MRNVIVVLAVAALAGRPATAQVERYELGQRLKRFEADWETADEAGRARALVAIRPLTRQYLTFQLGAAARTLDEARFALRAKPPTDAERWFAALAVRPTDRLVDATAKTIRVEIKPLYTPTVDAPKAAAAQARFALGGGGGEPKPPVDVTLGPKGAGFDMPLPAVGGDETAADVLLQIAFIADGIQAHRRMVVACRVSHLADRLEALRIPATPADPTIDQATAADLAEWFGRLAKREDPETDFSFAELFLGAEALRAGVKRPDILAEISHSDRLTVPTAGGKLTPCRVFVPPKLDPKLPVPVVVALHGMGGSENLFFEGYGAGCVVKACEKRGWMLVCPRSNSGFLGGPPPVTDILDKLTERYPIDKSRVFLMGHSMGAAQTIDLAQAKPGAFAAVAALGGGGRVRTPAAFAGVPTFVGVGTEDFARSGATGLAKALTDAGVKTVTLKEYPGVEHTLIVRMAVDVVFAAFDKVAAKR